MKIAVIGAGNMGGATALGLAAACPEIGITVTAKHAATLERFAARGLPLLRRGIRQTHRIDISLAGLAQLRPTVVETAPRIIEYAGCPRRVVTHVEPTVVGCLHRRHPGNE